MARSGRVRASQDLTVKGALGQLLQSELERLQVVSCVVGPGVPRAQETISGLKP